MSHEIRVIHVDRLTIPDGGAWSRLPMIGAAVAVIGIAGCWLLGRDDVTRFFQSWLVAFLYFLSICLGGLFFVLVHFATKAGWGVVVRRVAENIASVLPAFLLLIVPVMMGLYHVYHWSHEEAVANDVLLQGKQPYLNAEFFYVRAAFYLICWSVLAWWFASASRKQDRTGDHGLTRRMIAVSGPGLLVFSLTLTFAAFDWIMSLSPHWYSTIFGVYFFAGCLVAIFSFMILICVGLDRAGHLGGAVSTEHFHDLGKLLFAFNVFWAYIGFSQFFLIWYADIPEETIWFLERYRDCWLGLTIFLAVGHFGVPFFLLMPRTIKRRPGLLAMGAAWMLFMHLCDIYWLVMPAGSEPFGPDLLDLAALMAVGGVFLAVLGWRMKRQALIPVKDPRLIESLTFENS